MHGDVWLSNRTQRTQLPLDTKEELEMKTDSVAHSYGYLICFFFIAYYTFFSKVKAWNSIRDLDRNSYGKMNFITQYSFLIILMTYYRTFFNLYIILYNFNLIM